MTNGNHIPTTRFGTPLRRRLAHFGANQSGHAAVLFGIAMMPVAAVIGVSADYRAALTTRHALEVALEKVADDLFEHRRFRPQTEAQARAESIFRMALKAQPELSVLGLKLRQSQNSMELSTSGSVQTRFLSVVGIESLPVAAYAVVRPRPRHVDMLFAYDTADGTQLEATLTSLARKTLSPSSTQGARVRVGLLPYTDVVRVDADRFRKHSWLAFKDTTQGPKDAPSHGYATALLSPRNHWQGCIGSRDAEFAGQLKRTERSRVVSFHPAVDCADRDIPAIQPLADGWKPISPAPIKRRRQACADPALALRFALSTLSRGDVLGADPHYYTASHPDRETHIVVALPKTTAACPSIKMDEALTSLCRDANRRLTPDRKANLRITLVSNDAESQQAASCQGPNPSVPVEGKAIAERVQSAFDGILFGTDSLPDIKPTRTSARE